MSVARLSRDELGVRMPDILSDILSSDTPLLLGVIVEPIGEIVGCSRSGCECASCLIEPAGGSEVLEDSSAGQSAGGQNSSPVASRCPECGEVPGEDRF